MMMNKKQWLKKNLPALLACAGLLGYQTPTFAENVTHESNSGNQTAISEENGTIDVVYGGGNEETEGSVNGNRINITGGTVGGVLGGVSSSGDVTENTVEINGGNIYGVSGGISVVNNELKNQSGNVSENHVIIHGGTIKFVSGGEVVYTYERDNNEGLTDEMLKLGSGNVFNNTVEINGGRIEGDVIGGVALSGDAFNNTVVISGAPDLVDAYLYGGLSMSGDAYDNTLRIKTKDLTARNISNFNDIHFDLPEEIRDGDTVMKLTDGQTELGGTHVNVYTHGSAPIGEGAKIKLLTNSNGLNTRSSLASLAYTVNESGEVSSDAISIDDMTYNDVMNRGAVKHALALENDGTTLTAIVGPVIGVEVIPPPIPINPPVEGEFDDITLDEIGQLREQAGYEIFFNSGGGHVKTKLGNGAYVNNDTAHHDLGIARHFRHEHGIFSFAPVFTYSYGNYKAHLASGNRGDGNQQYAAGGVIVRSFNDSGFYYEGSIRAGRSHTKYVTDDFPVIDHNHMRYTANANLVMGHVRVGNQWRLGRDHILDVYGYYAHARQGSSETELNLGNRCEFNATNSGRFRTGYRLTSRLSRISQLYTGLAFQYDIHSDAISKLEGHETNNLKEGDYMTFGKDGASGMLEVGWLIRPLRDNPWTLDIHANGWVGLQQGVTAMAKVKKAF